MAGDPGTDFDEVAADPAQVDEALVHLSREQSALDAALAEHDDLGDRLGRENIPVRDLMVHRIEEYARHCGHADLLRECIDGGVGQ